MRLSIHLCIEPKNQGFKKYRSDWLSLKKQIRGLTENTGLYDDGRIYYDNLDILEKQRKFVICFPRLNPDLDKKSLWALLTLKLQSKDIYFFLDELVKASEMVENEKNRPG